MCQQKLKLLGSGVVVANRNQRLTLVCQQKLKLLGSGVVVAGGPQELQINFYMSTETNVTWFWCCCCWWATGIRNQLLCVNRN
jgi:hypothetical protein